MTQNVWNAGHYDANIGYVSRLGSSLIGLLAPKPDEAILDLGCGTGDLAAEIAAASGANVRGMDFSEAMVARAREKYPDIRFWTGDAQDFTLDAPVDAVFSNAALHWMKRRPEGVVASVWGALKPGGRFVAEFGGKDNIGAIAGAVAESLAARGIDAASRNPWYYPSLGEYAALLEAQGFRVKFAEHYDRPTPLDGGEKGLRNWLDAFCGMFFDGLAEEVVSEIYKEAESRLRDRLYDKGTGIWTADYVRLRVAAWKPGA
jgi:trans-aconitate methyltransferase